MLVKGIVSAIYIEENKAEIILPEYQNVVTKPLSIYGNVSVDKLEIDEFVLVNFFNDDFNDGIIIKIYVEESGIKEIPIASKEVIGGIKVGSNLEIEEDGTLNSISKDIEIVDDLKSESSDKALSANQGRILDESIKNQGKILEEKIENKADKIVVISKDGEVIKEIDLGFKMLEEEGNITKGQLIDKETKGVLYPETTIERVIGLDEELKDIDDKFCSGYLLKAHGNEYSGVSSNGGIEITKIEGNYKQETSNGYQLYDTSIITTQTIGNVTYQGTKDGFTVKGSGTLSVRVNIGIVAMTGNSNIKKLFKVGNLYLNMNEDVYPFPSLHIQDINNTNLLSLDCLKSTSKVITQEVLDKAERIYYVIYGKQGYAIKQGTIKPMVYQDGDGTWEKYTGGMPSPNLEYPQEIKPFEISKVESTKKNLIDFPYLFGDIGAKGNISGINYEVLTNKSVKLLGTNTSNRTVYLQLCKRHFGDVPLSTNKQPVMNGYAISGARNGTGIYIGYNPENKITAISIIKGAIVDTIIYPMVEKGTKVTSYEQPKGYVETLIDMNLRALPNGVKDIYVNGFINRRVGVVEFDGSSDENWNLTEYNNTFIRFDSKNMPNTIKMNGDGLSNRFRKSKNDDYENNKEFFRYSLSSKQAIVIVIRKDRLETPDVEGFKKFLQKNPSEFWFELETPTTKQVTLPTIPSYYPFTNVIHDSSIPTNIEWNVNTYRNGNFDDYYNKEEVDKKLEGKANSSHNHDDRYYTETEMNSKLSAKLDTTGNASNVTNTFTQASSLATLTTGEKLSISLGKIMKAITDLIAHIGNKSNPHGVTKAQVGLSNVDNTSDANKPISSAVQSALNGKANSSHSHDWGGITGKPSSFTPSSHTHSKSQINDFPSSMPASDVYSWAKQPNKPSYSWNEIGSKPSTFPPSSHSHDYLSKSGDTVTGRGSLYYLSSDVEIGCGSSGYTNNAYVQAYNGYCSIRSHSQSIYNNGAYIDSNWSRGKFYPSNLGQALGTSGTNNRWYRLYAQAACNTSSDRRLKDDIVYFEDMPKTYSNGNAFEEFFYKLKSSSFVMKDDEFKRIKFGFIAQDVIEALEVVGLTAYDVDFVSHGRDENDKIDENAMYGLCYEEFIALNTYMIQQLKKEIELLKKEIELLKK